MVTSEGYCPAHKPKVARKESAAWHHLYTDPRYHWAERRADQLIREPFCRECAKRDLRVPATDADHIVPHRGDVFQFMTGQLQSLCHSCHSRKTMQEMNQRNGAARL
jgi:5-methylcytosine-specific restriction protein A